MRPSVMLSTEGAELAWMRGTFGMVLASDLHCPGGLYQLTTLEVHIEQGHKHGAKVVLRGEAGCSDPNVQPGDVVFVLEQRPHKLFKRVSNDLVMDKVRAGARGSPPRAGVLCADLCRLHQGGCALHCGKRTQRLWGSGTALALCRHVHVSARPVGS